MVSLHDVRKKRQKTLQDTLATEIWFSIHFVRHLSVYLTWAAINLHIRANTITIVGYGIGIGAALVFSAGGVEMNLIGLALFHLWFLIDNVDGEVARCTDSQTLTGAYLDTVGHIVVNSLVNLGLAVGIYIQTGCELILLPGFLAAYCLVPISRYSMDHEILARLRKSDVKPDEIRNIGAKNSPRQIDKVFQLFSVLKKTGFPFIATPYNLIAISSVVIGDMVIPMADFGRCPVSLTALLVLYYGTILCLQQIGSFVRQLSGKRLESEFSEISSKIWGK